MCNIESLCSYNNNENKYTRHFWAILNVFVVLNVYIIKYLFKKCDRGWVMNYIRIDLNSKYAKATFYVV